MKKYIIRQWEGNKSRPQDPIDTITERMAKEHIECNGFHGTDAGAYELFRTEANKRIKAGDALIFIVHGWNYRFRRPDGSTYVLYMYEESK